MGKRHRKHQRKNERQKRERQEQKPQAGAPQPPVFQPVAEAISDPPAESNNHRLLWTLLSAAIGLLMAIGYEYAQSSYHQPGLDILYSEAILASDAQDIDGKQQNSAELVDTIKNCEVAGYVLRANDRELKPWSNTPEVYWKFLLHNTGRITLTNLTFSDENDLNSDVNVEGSPNVVINAANNSQNRISGRKRVATVLQLKPGEYGIVTISKQAGNASLRVKLRGNNFTFTASIPPVKEHIHFEGGTELSPGKEKMTPISTFEMLEQEARLDGEASLALPIVRGVSYDLTSEERTSWEFLIKDLTNIRGCSFPPGAAARTFHVSWPMMIHPKKIAKKP